MKLAQRHHRARGMSLLELCVVLAITLVVAAILAPHVMNAIYNVRLRAAANDLAGLLQDAHFRSIRDNTYYPVRSDTVGNSTVFYIDTTAAHNGTTWANSYPT